MGKKEQHPSDTLFGEKPRNRRNAEKTLEWSTIYATIVKISRFENPLWVFLPGIIPSGVPLSDTFNPKVKESPYKPGGKREDHPGVKRRLITLRGVCGQF